MAFHPIYVRIRTASSIVFSLCHIFNLYSQMKCITFHLALKWKSSFTVPIPKSSLVSNSSRNFRPILSLISKLLEKYIHHFFPWFLYFSQSHLSFLVQISDTALHSLCTAVYDMYTMSMHSWFYKLIYA